MKKLSVIAFLLLILAACTKKNIPADKSVLGLDYYPLQEGKFVVYEVDSTVFTEIPRDTIVYRYQIKEKIAESFTDNEGRTARRLERYIKIFDPAKNFNDMAWTMKEVWMLNADDQKVQVSESNIRYTKLIFPVEEKASWNGHAANTLGERSYQYDYIDKTETINNNKLESVLMVKQYDYPTLISKELYTEKYAKGVGLVYKEIINVRSNNIVPGKNIMDRIENGIIYHQTLVTYGYE